MALVNSRSGKCSNFGNCALADARQTIEVSPGLDFVCTECGKSLLQTEVNNTGGNAKTLIVAGLLVLAVLVAGGIAWSLVFNKKSDVVPDLPVPEVMVPPTTAKPETKPVDVPQPPVSGNCSDADAKAGLCRPNT